MTEPETVPGRGPNPLALGAILIATMAVLVGVLVVTGGEEQQVAAGSTSDPGESSTTTTTRVLTPSGPRSSGLISASDEQRAEAGLVLYGAETEEAEREVVLVTFEGVEMGRGPLRDWHMNNPDRGADLDGQMGGWTATEARLIDDPLPGCGEVHGAGGLRAAVCGPEPQLPDEIRVVAADGTSRRLSGRVDEAGGHWRWAVPSPDGRWVLAQWSGECEVPVAYLIEVASGERRAAVGDGAETMGVGWSPDGRAVVGLWPGYCGEMGDGPGMYLVDPVSRSRHRIHRYHEGGLLSGYMSYRANRLERVVSRARRQLGLEGCCGEPSHGGDDASDGFVFEGHDVGVYAAPLDKLPSDDSERMGQLRFDCGGARYFLSDWGPSGETAENVPDRELLQRAAGRLAPRLYCRRGPLEFSEPA